MSNKKRMIKGMLLAGITAFVFVFIFDFVVHGFLMKEQYEATMNVWRPQAEANVYVMLLSQFLFAMAIAFFYPIVSPDKKSKKAVPFAIGLALVMAMPQIATYSYLPIPITISLLWTAATFVEVFGASFLVAKIFNRFS